jgi:Na+/H+ antiporter NhaD/arsenite permease-like protein
LETGTMQTPWWGVIPFFTLLGCIAVFPLLPLTHHLWEKRKFQLGVALAFGLPVGAWMWLAGDSSSVVHALVEYAQFIVLLLSLFIVSGGIYVAGDLKAKPEVNVVFLTIGAVAASFVGTTGAAMLLIRPLLKTNAERENKVHTVVFAILVIANCGGLLTPLGDPPLFLGMLRGVPFLWTMHLLPEWLFTNGLLILVYWALDRRAYASERIEALARDESEIEPLSIHGKLNLLGFAAIICSVALLPSVDLHAIHEGHAHWYSYLPIRELVMLSVSGASLFLGSKKTRWEDNNFSWGPIQEVAALFIGIFLAMIPALKYLRQIAPELPLNEITLFAFTGGLSSVLDNAPTYVTFFEMARELPFAGTRVAGVPELYLVSVSLGSVFCGAMTYIGNGPNFMVKAVAEGAGVKMPSFGGYVARWSVPFLLPILAAMVMVFIAQPWPVRVGGAVIGLIIAAMAVRTGLHYKAPSVAPAAER